MDARPDQSPKTAERHIVRAKYLRTLARAASSADVAVTLIRLAVHYERLARESQGQPAPRRKPQRP